MTDRDRKLMKTENVSERCLIWHHLRSCRCCSLQALVFSAPPVKIKVRSAVKIKVPLSTHRPIRKTYRPMPIFQKCQISADISALAIYRSTTNCQSVILMRKQTVYVRSRLTNRTLYLCTFSISVHSEMSFLFHTQEICFDNILICHMFSISV